jgi:hypothetical protein
MGRCIERADAPLLRDSLSRISATICRISRVIARDIRGLIELVVLNIGYDLGILSGRIFAMMVSMALVTTFVTSPLLSTVKNHD